MQHHTCLPQGQHGLGKYLSPGWLSLSLDPACFSRRLFFFFFWNVTPAGDPGIPENSSFLFQKRKKKKKWYKKKISGLIFSLTHWHKELEITGMPWKGLLFLRGWPTSCVGQIATLCIFSVKRGLVFFLSPSFSKIIFKAGLWDMPVLILNNNSAPPPPSQHPSPSLEGYFWYLKVVSARRRL